MASKKPADPAVADAPVLGDDDAFSSQAAEPVPVVAGAAVHMKLPTFWPDAAEVWVAQADAQFAIRNLTSSKTKLYHAVAVLPQEVASQILDLIRAPLSGDPYSVLQEYVFVCDDASKPPLSPLYRGPYLVLRRSEKFFVLQIGDKKDVVSVDRLKPVFSSNPVVPGVPPVRGRP